MVSGWPMLSCPVFFPTQKRSHLAKPWSCRIRRQKVAEPQIYVVFHFHHFKLKWEIHLVFYGSFHLCTILWSQDLLRVRRNDPCQWMIWILCVNSLGGIVSANSQSPKGDKPSCLWKFSAMPLFGRLRDWRTAFKELHKLDQDRLVTWFLFSVIWVPIFPCFSSCCSSIWRIVSHKFESWSIPSTQTWNLIWCAFITSNLGLIWGNAAVPLPSCLTTFEI